MSNEESGQIGCVLQSAVRAGPPPADDRVGTPSERLFQSLAAHAPAAIFAKDLSGRYVFANSAACEARGRPEGLLGLTDHQIHRAEMAEQLCRHDREVLATGRAVEHEEVIRSGGTVRLFFCVKAPLFDASGRPAGICGVAVDITPRKLFEQSLRGNEKPSREAAQGFPTALYTCDGQGRVMLYNAAATELWGRELKIGEEWWRGPVRMFKADGVTPLPVDECPMTVALRDGQSAGGEEIVIERPDGTQRTVLPHLEPIRDVSGALVGTVNMLLDITDIKRSQEAMAEAAENAEEANRSKDRFLSILGHELRTPLTPVLMAASAIAKDAQLPLSVREDAAMICESVRLETKLIDDLLDLSRITNGKLSLQLEQVDLNEAVLAVCALCRPELQEKSMRLKCDLDPDVGEVRADPARLQQALWNVLKNAAKFTPEGGEIYVSTVADQGTCRVVMQDTGLGMSAETLPRIFKAFEQGDGSKTRRFGGLGLGLAISKLLVELHGGSIRAHSHGTGTGSTFTIELPTSESNAGESHSKTQPSPKSNARPQQQARLLVVDDHVDTARMLGRLLQASGFLVETANSAEQALEIAAGQPLDLVISDLGLPDASGYDLMRALRQRQGVKGVAMSGYGTDEDIRRSKEAGFCEHVVKPVELAVLEQAIRRALDDED